MELWRRSAENSVEQVVGVWVKVGGEVVLARDCRTGVEREAGGRWY